MGIIRGKIECNREVQPKRTTFGGPSPFIKINGKWVLESDHSKKAIVCSLAEFLKMASFNEACHNEG